MGKSQAAGPLVKRMGDTADPYSSQSHLSLKGHQSNTHLPINTSVSDNELDD